MSIDLSEAIELEAAARDVFDAQLRTHGYASRAAWNADPSRTTERLVESYIAYACCFENLADARARPDSVTHATARREFGKRIAPTVTLS